MGSEKFKCNSCGENDHSWYKIHYEKNSTLKNLDIIYISYCQKINSYTLYIDKKEINTLIEL